MTSLTGLMYEGGSLELASALETRHFRTQLCEPKNMLATYDSHRKSWRASFTNPNPITGKPLETNIRNSRCKQLGALPSPRVSGMQVRFGKGRPSGAVGRSPHR